MLEIEFVTERTYSNDQHLRSLIGSDQPLDASPSAGTPDPDAVEVEVGSNYIKIRWHGISKADATSNSIDNWSNSITNNLPNAVEIARRDV